MNQDSYNMHDLFNSQSNILVKLFSFFLQYIFNYIIAIYYFPKMNIDVFYEKFLIFELISAKFKLKVNLN